MNVFDLFATLSLDKSEYDKGLSDATKAASDLKDQWSKGSKQITKGLKDIGVGATIFTGLGAAAFKAADGVSQNLDQIDKMSQKLGLSKKAYQEWDYVLKISGADINNMSTGLKTLTNKFDDARNGGSGAIETFEKLGLSMEDIQGLSREDLFTKVITQFQKMEDSAERAALANDLFGKSGQELAPLFNTTAEETQNLIKEVNELGGVMSDEAVSNGARFQDSLTSLKTSFQGAGASIMSELVPAISDLMDKITQFIADGGLEKIVNLLKTLAPIISAVIVGFAGFKIISGLISIIQGFSTAFGILNAVMAANPIGLIILAIAGLVAAFVTLWNKCEGFRNFFENAFKSIGEFFSNFAKGVLLVKDKIVDGWNNLKEKTSETWNNIKDKVSETWDNVKEKTSKAWNAIKGEVEKNGGGIKGVLKTYVDGYKKSWEIGFNALDKITGGALGNVVNTIRDKFSNIKDKFFELIGGARDWGKDMIQNFIDGIASMIGRVVDAVSDVADKVKSFLHFSEPDEGPLSDFSTYAPDMMKLFAKGIKDNTDIITDQIAKSFDFSNVIMSNASSLNSGNVRTTEMSKQQQPIIIENHVVAELDGKQIFKSVRRENKTNTLATGYNALALL